MAAHLMVNIVVILTITSSNVLEAAFTSTPSTVSGCVGDSATFTWVYDNQADANSVAWDFGSTNVFNYQPSTGNTLPGDPQFAGRVTHNGDGSITLGTLTTNDAGSYTCTVTFNSNPTITDAATLDVNQPFTDSVSTILTVSGSSATVNLGSRGGVNVEWKNEAGTVVSRGTTYTDDGKITVCLTGCVSGSATTCQQIYLKSGGLKGDEIAGIVIAVCVVVIAAVVIVILWKKKLLCFKVPTGEKPTASTDSGIRSTSPNQVKPSVGNSTPMVESSNFTNSKVDTTENSKDPILDIDNKKRHTGVEPLTERSEGQPEINKNKPLPSIGQ